MKIQLFDINQRTLSVWYNNYCKKLEVDVLALSVPLPQISMVSHTPLPAAKQKALLHTESGTELPPFPFVENPDMSGQATRRGQRPPHPAPTLPAEAPSAPPAAAPSAPPAAAPSAPPAAAPSAPPAAAPSAPPAAGPSAPLAASPSAPPAASITSLSRTTLWRRRKAAEKLAQEQGLPRPQQSPRKDYTCGQCGQPRKKEFGHTRVGSFFYCATAEGKTVEELQQERRDDGNP
ncbi:transcriptional regulatory protein AlgP-like [Xyrauchen texanus]|uniref:transcriptional regulatory protein AlgP-like n=1 Tax=Xyrauchen texanus TaxID=154827 RepID=UPI002241A9FC|nr:transcriptional regulatory protein AlgP-like [Xyrauchen texanus]